MRELAQRLLLFCAVVFVSLCVAEIALRGIYPALPSHAALEGSGWRVAPLSMRQQHHFDLQTLKGRCASDLGLVPEADLRSWHGDSEGVPVEIWTLGDSVVAGAEVAADEAFPVLLGQALARVPGRQITIWNRAISGSSLCGRARQIAELAARPERPDLLLVFISSDDLEDYRLYSFLGRVVAPVDDVLVKSPALLAVLRRSYMANLVWYGWVARFQQQRSQRVDAECASWATRVFTALHRLAQEERLPMQVVLLPAPGLEHCQPGFEVNDMCTTLTEGQATIVEGLEASGLPFEDMRGFWRGSSDPSSLGSPGVVVHPDAEGHARIAAHLLPLVEQVLAQ